MFREFLEKKMGLRGPKTKPTNLKLLEGNPGKRPLNTNEPQPATGAVCPIWLSDAAKEHWAYLAPTLESCGILTKADEGILASYCDAWVNYVRASKEVANLDNMTIGGDPNTDMFNSAPQGTKINPIIMVQKNYAELVLKFGCKLGLNPSDRTGIKVSGSTQPQSKWANKITQ